MRSLKRFIAREVYREVQAFRARNHCLNIGVPYVKPIGHVPCPSASSGACGSRRARPC
jgi:hypothetical protein